MWFIVVLALVPSFGVSFPVPQQQHQIIGDGFSDGHNRVNRHIVCNESINNVLSHNGNNNYTKPTDRHNHRNGYDGGTIVLFIVICLFVCNAANCLTCCVCEDAIGGNINECMDCKINNIKSFYTRWCCAIHCCTAEICCPCIISVKTDYSRFCCIHPIIETFRGICCNYTADFDSGCTCIKNDILNDNRVQIVHNPSQLVNIPTVYVTETDKKMMQNITEV